MDCIDIEKCASVFYKFVKVATDSDVDVKDLWKEIQEMEEMEKQKELEQTPSREATIHGMKFITLEPLFIDEFLPFIEKAKALLDQKNMSKVWEGVCFISSHFMHQGDNGEVERHKEWGGAYTIPTGQISIYSEKADEQFVNNLIHELGHRLWFKGLTQKQREKFEDLIQTSPRDAEFKMFYEKPEMILKHPTFPYDIDLRKQLRALIKSKYNGDITLAIEDGKKYLDLLIKGINNFLNSFDNKKHLDNLRQKINQIIEQTSFIPLLVQLHPKIRDSLNYFNEIIKSNIKPEKKIQPLKNSIQTFYLLVNEILVPEKILEIVNIKPVDPVSGYGHTNIREAFAEMFLHYITNRNVTRDQSESFKEVLKFAIKIPKKII
jgi:hypothetical protein